MAGYSDAKLTGLAAEILREAVQFLDHEDVGSWLVAASVSVMSSGQTGAFAGLTGTFPAVTEAFPSVTGAFNALTGSFAATTQAASGPTGAGLKKVFKLPGKLPALRLPPRGELADMARSAPLMTELEKLATWLGRDGRRVTEDDWLSRADAADAAQRIGVQPEYLPYLWDYALTTGWLELAEDTEVGGAWAQPGETAWRWANDDESGVLHVWAVVFAAVTARTLDRAASMGPRASRRLRLEGQGVATAVRLFLARREGLSGADVSELLKTGAIGNRPPSRSRRAWDGWVRGCGNPTRLLLGELAALRAIDPPDGDRGPIELTPLALWALREQLRLDGIEIPLLKAASAQMSAAALVHFVDGVSEAEGEAEFASWVGSRGPDAAADELLAFALFGGPQARLAAMRLVRRIGAPAHPVLRGTMPRPELRPYARIALAAALPEDSVPPALTPDPDDLVRLAIDLLALACGQPDPDPAEVAEQLTAAVPVRLQPWIIGLMSHVPHPEVVRLLTVLSRFHPDRGIAKEARRAARSARKRRTSQRDRVLAR